MPRKTTTRFSPAITAKAAKIEQRLRDHHALGMQVNSLNEPSTKQYAEEHGLNENTLRKIRAFAREYTATQLDALCKGRRPNGLPLHWGYAPVLLSIPDKDAKQIIARRTRFQELAISKGLSVVELRQAILREFPRENDKFAHGRNIQKPRNVEEGLTRIKTELEVLGRRCKILVEMARQESNPLLQRRLKRAAEELKRLAQSLR